MVPGDERERRVRRRRGRGWCGRVRRHVPRRRRLRRSGLPSPAARAPRRLAGAVRCAAAAQPRPAPRARRTRPPPGTLTDRFRAQPIRE